MSYKNKTPSPLPKSMTLSSPSKLYTFGDLKLFPLLLAASKANEFFFGITINESKLDILVKSVSLNWDKDLLFGDEDLSLKNLLKYKNQRFL